jgi:hypothetical protein
MMKVFLTATLASALLVPSVWHSPAHADKLASATDLVRDSEKRHRIPAEKTVVSLVLQDKDGGKKTMSYTMLGVQADAGDRLMIRFAEPADIRATALLSVDDADDDPNSRRSEQWLYLPAFKRTRQIGAAALGDRFVGTDLFFEDLRRRHVDDYTYKLLGSEEIDGQACHVIEATPARASLKKESPYGKSQLWLRKDNLALVKARYFDRSLQPLKEIVASDLVSVGGKAWRPGKIEIVDIQRKHRTTLFVKSRDLASITPETFSRHNLAAP